MNCFVAGVNPKKAGEDFEGITIYGTVKEAKAATGATVSVIYVPPPFAAAAIDEAVDADLDLVVCITEGIPVRDMIRTRYRMQGKRTMLLGPNCPGGDHARRNEDRHHARATSTARAASASCRAPERSPTKRSGSSPSSVSASRLPWASAAIRSTA